MREKQESMHAMQDVDGGMCDRSGVLRVQNETVGKNRLLVYIRSGGEIGRVTSTERSGRE